MTDATSIAVHQFVLPLKHGYATVNIRTFIYILYVNIFVINKYVYCI